MHCQKQNGSKDCGVFSIGFSIVLGLNPGKMFLQPVMRAHLVNCFNKAKLLGIRPVGCNRRARDPTIRSRAPDSSMDYIGMLQ